MVSNLLHRLVAYLIICSIFLLSSCSAPKSEGFAIYLTKDDIAPDKMEVLSHVDLTSNPLVSIEDIISYDAHSHVIKLTESAYERITQLEIPMSGKSFLVCVNNSPLYWGAFWSDLSSHSFDGVTVNPQESHAIALELGYPSPSFFTGDDPRNDIVAMNSLDQAEKLINKP